MTHGMPGMRKGVVGDHGEEALRTGWAQGGPINVGQTAGVRMQARFGVLTEFTVTIDSNASANGIVAFTKAVVTWTVNGNPIVRTIDVGAGASISGLGESVMVVINDVTNLGAFPSAAGKSYNVTVSVATNPRPTTAVPPILTGIDASDVDESASTANIPVPAGANSVAVYGGISTGAATLRLRQMTADNSATLLSTIVTLGQFVPLVAGAGLVAVDNLSMATASVNILFGIDG